MIRITKQRKFKNTPVIVDGVRFDSKKESIRWHVLRLLERAGDISELQRQVRYELTAHGKKIGHYVADFAYFDNTTKTMVEEDVKGMATPMFKWKAKHFAAQYGREIRITK